MSKSETKRTSTPIDGPLPFYIIGGAALLLLLIGIVMVLSATTITSMKANDGNPFADFFSQAKFVLIGLPLTVAAMFIPVKWYRVLAWPALIGAFLLQMLIFTGAARGQGGNTNWIWIPGLNQSIQPSEFLKIALALWLGTVLASQTRDLSRPKDLLLPLGGAVVAMGLVFAGHDLGTMLVLVLMVVAALWFAGMKSSYFIWGGLTAIAGLTAAIVSSESRRRRVLDFIGLGDPDPSGAGYQTLHGLWGLGTGGLTGVGLGASREKWSYLPAAHNDFIFAILGEELGLIGTLLVLGLFAALAAGMMLMIARHPSRFVQITTAAFMAWIIGQALINIGVVTTLMPVIGVPLPLVSAGGSAMVSTLIALGIILAFARDIPGAKGTIHISRKSRKGSFAVVGARSSRG